MLINTFMHVALETLIHVAVSTIVPRKHKALSQCWLNGGPTLAQRPVYACLFLALAVNRQC